MNYHNLGHVYCSELRFDDAIQAFETGRRLCDRQLKEKALAADALTNAARINLYLCRAYRQKPLESTWRSTTAKSARSSNIDNSSRSDPTISRPPGNSIFRTWNSAFSTSVANNGTRRSSRIEPHDTLKKMIANHGVLASHMVQIQAALAELDYNLINCLVSDDPVRHDREIRIIVNEAYEICDKIVLVTRRLTGNLPVVLGLTSFAKADYRKLDDERSNFELLLESERTWEDCLRQSPKNLIRRAI